MPNQFKYDVAISFAEEDRCVALAIALALELEGFKNVYYYPDNKSAGWGKDLSASLTEIFVEQAKYAVVLFSDHYLDKRKVYTLLELQAIEIRAKRDTGHVYMLPVIVDTINTESFDASVEHIKWEYNPRQIAKTLKELLGSVTETPTPKKSDPGVHNEGDFPIFLFNSKVNKITQNTANKDGK